MTTPALMECILVSWSADTNQLLRILWCTFLGSPQASELSDVAGAIGWRDDGDACKAPSDGVPGVSVQELRPRGLPVRRAGTVLPPAFREEQSFDFLVVKKGALLRLTRGAHLLIAHNESIRPQHFLKCLSSCGCTQVPKQSEESQRPFSL